MGYVIIPKLNWSGRESINSRCRRFDLLLFHRFGAICRHDGRCCRRSACHRSDRLMAIDRPWPALINAPFRRVARWFIQLTLARDLIFAKVFECFYAYKKMLGRTEMRTRERKEWQSIRTVWDISRDDRARIASCTAVCEHLQTYLRRMVV